jgi:hypothetical protein
MRLPKLFSILFAGRAFIVLPLTGEATAFTILLIKSRSGSCGL